VTALTAWAAVRATGFPMTLSLSDAFTVGSTLLYGPWVGALTVACDAAIMSLRLNRARMTPMRLGFNITAPPLALWISSQLLFRVLGQGPFAETPPTPATLVAPLLAFAGVYFLLNSWLIAGANRTGKLHHKAPARAGIASSKVVHRSRVRRIDCSSLVIH
jgi:hypothetical protein